MTNTAADTFWTGRTRLALLSAIMLTGAFITNGFLPIPMMAVRIVAALIAIWLLMAHSDIWQRLLSNRLLVLLLLLPMLSALWSPYPLFTLRRAIALLTVTLLGMYVAGRFDVAGQIRFYMTVMGFLLISSLLFVVFLPEYAVMTGSHDGRWNGVLVHKNVLARLMTILYLLLLYLPAGAVSMQRRWRWLLMAGALLVIFFAESASAWIIVLVFTLVRPMANVLFVQPLLFVGGGLLLLIAAAWALAAGLLYYEPFFALFGRDPTLTGRVELWTGAWRVIELQPLVGQGYSVAFLPGAPIFNWLTWQEAPNAHNAWLDIGLELGLVGVTIYTLSLIQNLIRVLRRIRATRDALWLAVLVFLLAFIATSLTDTSAYILRDMTWMMYVSVTLTLTPAQ